MLENLAIIQARTGSVRLRNKMLKKINNYKLIEWVIKRVKKSKEIKYIVLATTRNKKDLKLVEIAKKNNIGFYKGKTLDVLSRFYNIALKYEAKKIIRICADNPFIDSDFLDNLIIKFKYKIYDYGFNHQSKLNYKCIDGFGAEIFKFETLKKISKTKNKYFREHVTAGIWNNLKKYKIQFIKPKKKFQKLNIRYDIDTQQDLNKLRNFVKKNKINLLTSASKIVSFNKYQLL